MAAEYSDFSATFAGGFVTVTVDPNSPNQRVGLIGYSADSDVTDADVEVDNVNDPLGAPTATQIYNTLAVPATTQVLQNRLPAPAWTTKGDQLRVRVAATAAAQLTVFYTFSAG